MPRQTPHLFVSATSKGLKEYREEAGRALRQKGIFAVIQEEFDTDYRTIRAMLMDKIASCDGVICLIGPFYGFEPKERSPGDPRQSYTQLEFFIAQELGKPIYRFFGADCPDFASVEAEPAELAQLQRDFIARLRGSDEIFHQFSDRNSLRDLVLRIAVPPHDPERKPQNLPYPSLGQLFKGRDEFLKNLRDNLMKVQRRVVYGMGGVGKTRLAVEYSLRHAPDYSALLFVRADTPETLRLNLAALCGPLVLNLPEKATTEEQVRVDAALRWLQEHPGWLLILDSVDTPSAAAAAEDLLSRLQGGHVLITSRLSDWSGGVETRELDVLTAEASEIFLLERTEQRRRKTANDTEDARNLACELGGLALALEQAGAFIHQNRSSLGDYLKRWCAQDDKVRQWFDERLMKYPRSVATTWNTTLDRLSPAAADLLRNLSWMAADPIPRIILRGREPEEAQKDSPGSLRQERLEGQLGASCSGLEDALAELANYSLAKMEADGTRFRIHQLVQEVTRQRQTEEERRATLESALKLIDAAAPPGPGDVRTWSVWDPLRRHVEAVTAHADRHDITDPTSRLMNQLAILLLTKALHSEAEPLMRRALAIDEQSFGKDHPDVARDLNNLAQLLQATNRLAEAEPLMRRGLEILLHFTRRSGHENPNLRPVTENYIYILKSMGLGNAESEKRLQEVMAEAGGVT